MNEIFSLGIQIERANCIHIYQRSYRPTGSNFKVMRRAERAKNFLDYLRCYICLKSCKCKPKQERQQKSPTAKTGVAVVLPPGLS